MYKHNPSYYNYFVKVFLNGNPECSSEYEVWATDQDDAFYRAICSAETDLLVTDLEEVVYGEWDVYVAIGDSEESELYEVRAFTVEEAKKKAFDAASLDLDGEFV